MCTYEKQMFPCRNDFCNKYVKGVISDLYEITKFEIQTTKKKFCTIHVIVFLLKAQE